MTTLKEARLKAGLSREQAGFRLHIGSRTLANYEAGLTTAPPEVVLAMGEVYEQPDLPGRYCSKLCPIGQIIAHQMEKDHIATMVLGLLKEFEDVERLKSRLIGIAADGHLAEEEKPEFMAIMREACHLEKEIGELRQFALRQGIRIEDIMPRAKEKDRLKAAR